MHICIHMHVCIYVYSSTSSSRFVRIKLCEYLIVVNDDSLFLLVTSPGRNFVAWWTSRVEEEGERRCLLTFRRVLDVVCGFGGTLLVDLNTGTF